MRLNSIAQVALKELALYFSSPIGYLFLTVYLGVTLFVFFWVEAFFARNIADVRPMFEWLPILLIFLAAAITMRIWSDERRTGTIEFLVTLPATPWELVLGKFFACVVLLLVALLLTLPLPISVAITADLDWGPVIAGYAAAVLLGATYLSVGVFVSARTENQIVALILTTFLCGILYLLGSPLLTDLFTHNIAELMRGLGAGSRFESITRGVLDFRDLYYYGSVATAFLVLNVLSLHQLGWTQRSFRSKPRTIQLVTVLIIANVLLANVWLSSVKVLRWDVTEANQYSISSVTDGYLDQLTEPLLIRGYFSSKTHPLLAPLAPQMADLLQEYAVAGGNRVRVEIVDPIKSPELEDEANTKYGIRPVPFQIKDRYQASLVNSYFDVLVQYGDEYEVLGFRELIEVKAQDESNIDVVLNNPEYALTRAIRTVISGFQSGGSTFAYINDPISFVGYVSADSQLPPELVEAKSKVEEVLKTLEEESAGKFSWQFLDPDDGDGAIAQQISENYGFRPMAASLFSTNTFYFYLTFTDQEVIVSVPLPDTFEEAPIKRAFEEGLKRFASGLMNSVALSTPVPPPQNPYQRQPQIDATYNDLRAFLETEFQVTTNYLGGPVKPATDVLVVVEPTDLSEEALFHLDQFLMQGGTVVIASSAYKTTFTQSFLSASPTVTGLEEWLAHHGVTISNSMVLDRRNARFPIPVTREVGGLTFQEIQMYDYPYFVDVRSDGFTSESQITRNLDQVALSWVSPIEVDASSNQERTVTEIIHSTADSWTEMSPDLMPRTSADGGPAYQTLGETAAHTLAVTIEGRFNSFFEESPLLKVEPEEEKSNEEVPVGQTEEETEDTTSDSDEPEEEEDNLGTISSVIERSPESSRLVVFGSSQFVSDTSIQLLSSASGSLYQNSLQLIANVVDWSVEDSSLMSIRGRGQFNRTLPPLSEQAQFSWELTIYALTIVGLLVTYLVTWGIRRRKNRSYEAILGIEA